VGPSVEVREEEDEDGRRVKVITSAISLVPSEKLDQDTARAIAAVARGATGGLGIKIACRCFRHLYVHSLAIIWM
jgi:hypothetical protein